MDAYIDKGLWCDLCDNGTWAVRALHENAPEPHIWAQSDWQHRIGDTLTCVVGTNDTPGTPRHCEYTPLSALIWFEHLSLLSTVSKDYFFLSPYRCVCVCVCLCVCVTAVAPISLTRKDSFHPPPPALPVPISICETGVLCSAGWLFDNMPVSALRIILITVFPIVRVKRITIPFDDAQCWKTSFQRHSQRRINIFIYLRSWSNHFTLWNNTLPFLYKRFWLNIF